MDGIGKVAFAGLFDGAGGGVFVWPEFEVSSGDSADLDVMQYSVFDGFSASEGFDASVLSASAGQVVKVWEF